MIRRLLFLAFFISVGSGCASDVANQIKNLSGRAISFDLPLAQLLRDSMSTAYRIPADPRIKFVVLYDSTECSSCRVNMLNQYDDLFNRSNSAGSNFLPIIIFSPGVRQIRNLTYDLKNSEFSYPIYIDSCHNFCKLNPHIPSDSRFHTFLLNQKNEIVLVGNPINNPQLWKLYEDTINSLNNNNAAQQ